MTMLRELQPTEVYGEPEARGYLEYSPDHAGEGPGREDRDPVNRGRLLASPARGPAAAAGRPADVDVCDLDSRTRRFAEIQSLIAGQERDLRCRTWEVPEGDVRPRLLAAERAAHRRAAFAGSARLAGLRRGEIT